MENDIINNKKIKKKRESNLSLDIHSQKNYKNKNRSNIKNNNYEITNSFEKIINDKINKNKNKTVQERINKYKNDNKKKVASYKFKNKEEMEKEIEAGALLYLQNDYKLKKKFMDKNNDNVSIEKTKRIQNKNNIISNQKRIFKSTDEKRPNTNRFDLEKEKIFNSPKYLNTNRNKKAKQKAIKFNSSTTINSSSNGNNNKYIKSPINNIKNNTYKNSSKNEIQYQKNNSGLFKDEYKKIMQFNKKKLNRSQEKNYTNKNLLLNIDNINQNDIKNFYANNPNKSNKNMDYNITSPFSNREHIQYYINPKTGDRKYPQINKYSKKNNFIPTTNYTNSESPRYTRLITFQGKGNNNIKSKI